MIEKFIKEITKMATEKVLREKTESFIESFPSEEIKESLRKAISKIKIIDNQLYIELGIVDNLFDDAVRIYINYVNEIVPTLTEDIIHAGNQIVESMIDIGSSFLTPRQIHLIKFAKKNRTKNKYIHLVIKKAMKVSLSHNR